MYKGTRTPGPRSRAPPRWPASPGLSPRCLQPGKEADGHPGRSSEKRAQGQGGGFGRISGMGVLGCRKLGGWPSEGVGTPNCIPSCRGSPQGLGLEAIPVGPRAAGAASRADPRLADPSCGSPCHPPGGLAGPAGSPGLHHEQLQAALPARPRFQLPPCPRPPPRRRHCSAARPPFLPSFLGPAPPTVGPHPAAPPSHGHVP